MPDHDPSSTAPERDAAPPPSRRWLAATVGVGLAIAAVIGVIIVRSDGGDDDGDDGAVTTAATTPDTTPPPSDTAPGEPTTSPAPSTTDLGQGEVLLEVDPASGCITVATAAGSAAGCPQRGPEFEQLVQRSFVADLDGPILITSSSSDPLDGLTAVVDDGAFAARCRWDDLAPRIPTGGIVEVVVCNDTGVMGVPAAPDVAGDRAMSYFTLPTPYLPEGTDLGPGSPVAGMPGALGFVAPVPDATTCTLLLVPDRSGWREACGFGDGFAVTATLVQLDGSTLHEISVDPSGSVTAAERLVTVSPSSGCSIGSTNELARAMPPASMITGIGCLDDEASLTTGSVLTQAGPPDGSIWLAERTDGAWAVTDYGTGIDNAISFPVVPVATWSTWPETTVPGFRAYWWEPIVAIPAQPTVDAFAAELLVTLGALATDPEFPPNERLLTDGPDGLPLVVAQVDIGGDDSVAGAVIHVWLEEEFDDSGPIGWRAGQVLAGEICARGLDADANLCV